MKDKNSTHTLTFQYNDGQVLNINLPSEKVDSFLENLNQSRMFWVQPETDDQLKDNGFWTNPNELRFIKANLKKEDNEVVV